MIFPCPSFLSPSVPVSGSTSRSPTVSSRTSGSYGISVRSLAGLGVKSPGSEQYKRYRWVYPSGTIIDGYQSCSAVPLSIGFVPMGATSPIARRCFHRDKLGGEPAEDSSQCSGQLLPPSGQARMEGCGFEPSKPFTSSVEWRVVDCMNMHPRETCP